MGCVCSSSSLKQKPVGEAGILGPGDGDSRLSLLPVGPPVDPHVDPFVMGQCRPGRQYLCLDESEKCCLCSALSAG